MWVDTSMMGNSIELSEDNGSRFCGKTIPEEIVIHIFLYVPVKDLIRSATHVCKYWHHLLTQYHFWFTRMQVEGYKLSETTKQRLLEETNETLVLRALQSVCGNYLHLNKNLILNPSGIDGFQHWMVRHGGDKMIVEDTPTGSDLIPEEAGLPTQHCFVTSYIASSRCQVVNLEHLGLDPCVIDILRPEIHISEWVSARWDCHSKSTIAVLLKGADDTQQVDITWNSRTDDVICRQWYKMQKVVADYPTGLKQITFTNIGKDLQFWAGHYGAKTAGSSVKFVL
ncbi:F-box only protein 44-like isoform X2 [Homarus americanus]|uniref:F-box only protein 44-like isoform X2 n=1 Tax=Homarus americanus TaxID=6706 RepID=UPI001C490E71|nr:F-box only protein 44-like isoform X2 [Homarus americanus]